MFEILSWVGDYKLQRYVEFTHGVSKSSAGTTVYLQATRGSRPNVIGRPNKTPLNFLLADAPTLRDDDGSSKSKPPPPPHYTILPVNAHHSQENKLWMLSLAENEKKVSFEDPVVPRRRHVIGVKSKNTKEGSTEYLGVPDSELSLKILPSTRKKGCECGCITQDQEVTLQRGRGTLFTIS